MIMQAAQREKIARGTQSGDLAQGDPGDVGMMTEWLTLLNVRQVDLDGG